MDQTDRSSIAKRLVRLGERHDASCLERSDYDTNRPPVDLVNAFEAVLAEAAQCIETDTLTLRRGLQKRRYDGADWATAVDEEFNAQR